jgi:DNA-binding beta-propeller fold protein YncE
VTDPATQFNGPLCPPPNNTLTACSQLFLNQITLQGTGTASIKVNNGTNGNLTLWGGLAVDPATNQAFVVMSGSNQIDVIDLGWCSAAHSCVNPFNALKPAQITEILVPSPNPGLGVIGGVPNATVPQGTVTSAKDLAGVQIFGSGFDAATTVRLDGTPLPASDVSFVNSRQLTVTIPANPYLSFPHRYALDLVNSGGSQSNPTDFFVIQAVDLSNVCPNVVDAHGNPLPPHPSSVAIADQLANGPFKPVAVVTNSNCNSVSIVDINPSVTVNGQVVQNPSFGTILNSIAVGNGPQGIAISQPLGLAVVANNAAGTASIVNLLTGSLAVPDVATGTNPTGVAINDETAAAIVTNTSSNTISEINMAPLFASTPATSLTPISIGGFQQPTAVAIDPDRGTNNQGIAVITSLQLVSGAAPTGALQVVDIGETSPALSTTLATGTVTAPSTGIVFDPTVITGTANNGVFYASSSGGDVISSFNPDSGSASSVNVGINPTALALNPQTGAIMTTNVAGKTTSIVDTTSSPLKTIQTIGLPGSPQFGIAIDQFTNLAVIVDQGNNRLLILPVPN